MPINVDKHEFLRSRRSVRRFRDDPVSPEILSRILETTFFSPSAHNRQPWRFAIASTPKAKIRLAEKMASDFRGDLAREGLPSDEIEKRIERSRSRIVSAPVVIVISLDETELDVYPDVRRQNAETLMGVQSVAMAGLQLLLAAHAEGLGAVWTCGPIFAPAAVKAAFDLPDSWEPQGLILIGYPDETPQDKKFKVFHDLVMYIE
jgi:coenzyme F420-0:L-glutamate ligase / coenzyme F420-1:gamma-L-glutamate ligase